MNNATVKREEVRALLHVCENRDTSVAVRDGLVAELCRTWLSVQDAPAGMVKEVGGSLVMIGELSEPFRASAERVRIVPYGEVK